MADKGKGGKDKIKTELKELMSSFDHMFPEDEYKADIIDKDIKDIRRSDSMLDFEVLNPVFRTEAIDVVETMYRFYVDMDIMDADAYTQKKNNLLATNLAGILFQLKSVKTVLERLTEEITAGDTTPRLIEVFSQLHEKYSNIIKSNANYLLFLEEVVRGDMMGNTDAESTLPEHIEAVEKKKKDVEDKSEYYISSDQKKMTEDLKVESGDVIDEKIDYSLIDPMGKSDLMEREGIDEDLVKDDDEEDLDGYGSILDVM